MLPDLQTVFYKLMASGFENLEKAKDEAKPGRFPVSVRPETRRFLDAQAAAFNTSIAGMAGAILDGIAMASFSSTTSSALLSVVQRVQLLIREHEVSAPATAAVLAPIGITVRDLFSDERLMEALTAERLQKLAEMFFVEYDWLVGKSSSPVNGRLGAWYKSPENAGRLMVQALEEAPYVELCLVAQKKINLDDLNDHKKNTPHVVPVLIRRTDLPGNEVLERFDPWEDCRWSYDKCRFYMKFALHFAAYLADACTEDKHFTVTGTLIEPADFARLMQEQVLPATLLSSSHRHVHWHPTDYVQPWSPAALQSEEWKLFRDGPGFKEAAQHLERIRPGYLAWSFEEIQRETTRRRS